MSQSVLANLAAKTSKVNIHNMNTQLSSSPPHAETTATNSCLERPWGTAQTHNTFHSAAPKTWQRESFSRNTCKTIIPDRF